jgi:hypothetical protein
LTFLEATSLGAFSGQEKKILLWFCPPQ